MKTQLGEIFSNTAKMMSKNEIHIFEIRSPTSKNLADLNVGLRKSVRYLVRKLLHEELG